MSGKGRRNYSKSFKSKVALEAVKGQKTCSELSSEFSIHASQINTWKKQLLEALPDIFSLRRNRVATEFEAERDRLYRQIGKLQVELDWLKKKCGQQG